MHVLFYIVLLTLGVIFGWLTPFQTVFWNSILLLGLLAIYIAIRMAFLQWRLNQISTEEDRVSVTKALAAPGALTALGQFHLAAASLLGITIVSSVRKKQLREQRSDAIAFFWISTSVAVLFTIIAGVLSVWKWW